MVVGVIPRSGYCILLLRPTGLNSNSVLAVDLSTGTVCSLMLKKFKIHDSPSCSDIRATNKLLTEQYVWPNVQSNTRQ